MHFSNIIKATTGVMAIGGVNAGLVMPQARSEAGIQLRDFKGVLTCGTCIGVVKGIVKAAENRLNQDQADSDSLMSKVESVGVGYTGKQLCEKTDIFKAVNIDIPGAPFCKDSDEVTADGETVNGKKTSSLVAEANKNNDNIFQKGIELAGQTIIAHFISKVVENVLSKSSSTDSPDSD
ncbi:hypothetical protein F4809DRAFT_523747 [Biscogniauxia mediterranea]|nr:hypothetical protein F4809DRAFT_523747 [Biscogniauxia mediterranea]